AARRAGARSHPHLAQSPRHLRGRRPDHRPAARPQRRAVRPPPDDAAGGRCGDHRRHADEGLRYRDGGGARMTSDAAATDVAPAFDVAEPEESFGTRLWENFKGGNLGSLPVIVGLTIIVILFGFTAQNFFTAVNFNNIIVQMAGTTMLAFGVVFVLLLGEIDLSIAYLSGFVGVLCAELQQPDSGHFV